MGLLAVGDTRGVPRGASDLVPVARQVLRRAAADEHDGVLLEVVALTGDVGTDLGAVRQPHAGNLAEGRVRLPGGLRHHARADAALLRGAGQCRGLHLRLGGDTALADELIDGGQRTSGFVPFHTTTVGGAAGPANRTRHGTGWRVPPQTRNPAWEAQLHGPPARFSSTC